MGLSVAAIVVVLGGPAGYALARLRFRGSSTLLLLYLLTRMVPPVALMNSLLFVKSVGLLDDVLGLILVDAGVALPFGVWVLGAISRPFPASWKRPPWSTGARGSVRWCGS